MLEKVKERLKTSLDMRLMDNDSVALTFALNKAGGMVKNLCNLYEVPEELEHVLIERVCGEFLLVLSQTNRLPESFNAESAIKSVKLGRYRCVFCGRTVIRGENKHTYQSSSMKEARNRYVIATQVVRDENAIERGYAGAAT